MINPYLSNIASGSGSAAEPLTLEEPTLVDAPVRVLRFHGSLRGNFGPGGAGAVIYELNGAGALATSTPCAKNGTNKAPLKVGKELWSGHLSVQAAKANEAEYAALIHGLEAAELMGNKVRLSRLRCRAL
ncbi:unnamed protein product [Phaeothamnion confervicola]